MIIDDKKDLGIVVVAGLGSCGVGNLCAGGVGEMYRPLIDSIGQWGKEFRETGQVAIAMANGASAVEPTSAMAQFVTGQAQTFAAGSVQFSLFATQMEKIVQVSQKAGMYSAALVGCIETARSFAQSWQNKQSKPLVLDMMEGGVQGSLIGLGAGALIPNEGFKSVQMMTGAGVGFATGMIGAFVGNMAGRLVKRVYGRAE